MASLQDKLARLHRLRRVVSPFDTLADPWPSDEPPPPAESPEPSSPLPAGTGLDSLEQVLLGEVQDGLNLKDRLERLMAAAGARGRRAAVPIEDLVAGREVAGGHGRFLLVEEEVPLDALQGLVPLARMRVLAPDTLAVLTGEAGFEGFDLAQAVFLDTETTGLAGGTGTAAFLVGVGFVDGEVFRLRQYLMRDYDEEAALLHALREELAAFSRLVTFNGKAFDVPLLESRFRLGRARWPLSAALHLDLLHPARRLWRARRSTCTLQSLEADLLGLRRQGDVPGAEIPRIYFDYVRRRDGRALKGVLEHNRQDVLSLAALSALAGQWVEGERADDPHDVYSLARVLERAAREEQSEAHYRRAAHPSAPAEVRLPSLRRLAARARRRGDHQAHAALLAEAAAGGDVHALQALAVHHEHRGRDLPAALEVVARAAQGLAEAPLSPAARRRMEEDLAHRRARLVRKLAARG